MADEFFDKQVSALRETFARLTGVDPDQFSKDEVLVTTRPQPVVWPFVAMIIGFGAATVVCVEERFADWAREQVPQDRSRANYFAIPLAAEAATRGERVEPLPPLLGWALSRVPGAQAPSDGYELGRVEKAWMDEWQPRERFVNALGHAAQVHRTFRNQYAYAATAADGEPAAVAGVYDTAGLAEIGVDVAPEHRQRGLAPIVVSAAARAIVDEGRTPFYECEVRNIASQHTALASGFLPACSLSVVMPTDVGLG